MGKVLIPIKEAEKSCKEPGQGHLGWAEMGSRSRQGWECTSKECERFLGTFSKPWANSGLRQSFPGSLTHIKPFHSSGFLQAPGPCRNAAPGVFAVLHRFCSSLQGWECNTWDTGAAWTMAEARMELGMI